MSVLEGQLVRTPSGVQGRVMAVALDEYTERDGDEVFTYRGFFALIQATDGTLSTVLLNGCEVLQQREPRPVPLPLAPHGVTR